MPGWDAAVELFQQLKSNQLGVRPNSVTYTILMSVCLLGKGTATECKWQARSSQAIYYLVG